MSTRRFYSPEIQLNSVNFILDEFQSAHLRTVLRLESGETINLFDGTGSEYECVIESVERKGTTIRVLNRVTPMAPESPLQMTLGIPLIKPANTDLMIRKAVELGVTNVVPLVTEHCGSHSARFKRERWEKIVIESSKQCGRATLMQIDEKKNLSQFISDSVGARFLFCESEGQELPDLIDEKIVTAVIGPEGGWSESEIKAAGREGFNIIHFGGRILRAETAAITVAGILQHRYGDMN